MGGVGSSRQDLIAPLILTRDSPIHHNVPESPAPDDRTLRHSMKGES